MKEQLKRIARRCGFEVYRCRPATSFAAQIAKAVELVGANVVFDVGANEGQFGETLREYGYRGKIVSFEPLTSARDRLTRVAAADEMWEVHEQCAVGNYDGEINLNVSGNSVSSSVLPILEMHTRAAKESAYTAVERVSVCRLDAIADQYIGRNTNLFLKVDTQGYEWEVLDGAKEVLRQTHGVICELSLVPLYEGQRLWRDIIDRLEADGFMLWSLMRGFTDPETGQSLQIDGIFLRSGPLQKYRSFS